MRRRDFLSFVGSATVWPFAAQAEASRTVVIGILTPESSSTGDIEGLREGLRDFGYVEGRDVKYRWAGGDFSLTWLPNLSNGGEKCACWLCCSMGKKPRKFAASHVASSLRHPIA
jgi:hypothetical protein